MIKEIHEQPKAIIDTYRGRMLANQGIIKMAGVDNNLEKFLNAKRIIIVACGYLLARRIGRRVSN